MHVLNAVRKLRPVVLALLAVVILPGTAAAQPSSAEPGGCASAQPGYRFLRFTEDWLSLRDPACRTDPWDGLKYLALTADGAPVLTLGGDARLQLINARHLGFGNQNDHNVLLQRYHGHASLRASDEVRLFAELKSNHQNGREPGPTGTDVDRLVRCRRIKR